MRWLRSSFFRDPRILCFFFKRYILKRKDCIAEFMGVRGDMTE